MVVIDASVWVSFFTPQDVHNEQSFAWLTARQQSGEPMLSPTLLLPEVGGAIARRLLDPDLGRDAINVVRTIPEVELIPIDFELGDLAAALAASLRLRGADATYVAVAYQFDIPLVTWDRELLARASAVIQTYTPLSAPSTT